MLQHLLIVVGVLCVGFVGFFLSDRLWGWLEKLGEPVPLPPPYALMTRMLVNMWKFFEFELQVAPKTKQEKELVQEITKILVLGRVLLAIGAVCFLVAYLLHNHS